MANWEHRWPNWKKTPDSGHPAERGGCTEDAAYDAGLIPEPLGWTQPVQTYWDPRLDPESDQYDPQFADAVAYEEPLAADAVLRGLDLSQPGRGHRAARDGAVLMDAGTR
jgi:hypothetical protein